MLGTRFANGLVSKYRTSYRFHNQRIDWTFKDLDYYSDAFLAGLQENKIAAGSTIATWLDDKHAAETITAYVGAIKNGSKILPISSLIKDGKATAENLRKIISDANPTAVLFSPNQSVDGVAKSEILSKAFPEAAQTGKSGFLELGSAKNLKFMIQTGYYSRPGFVKYRDFCVYAPPTIRKLVKQDFSKELNEFQNKSKIWPAVKQNDQVFWISGFDDYNQIMRAVFETAATGNLLDFISKETLQKSDFAFVNELEGDQKLYFIGTKDDLEVAKSKVKHKESHYLDVSGK